MSLVLHRITGNFEEEKTFTSFDVLWLFTRVFSTKFGSVASFGTGTANNPHNLFWQKSFFFPINSQKFSPAKFLLYGTCIYETVNSAN